MSKSNTKLLDKLLDKQPTAPIHFILAALSGYRVEKGDIFRVLSSANIAPNLINEPHARVTSRQFSKLVQLVAEELQDEFLGLSGHKAPQGTFELMAFGVIHCQNLKAAIDRSCHFYSTLIGGPLFELRVLEKSKSENKSENNASSNNASLVLLKESIAEVSSPFIVEALFTAMHRFICWLVDKKVEIAHATFSYPAPAHKKEYPPLFGESISFSEEVCSLSFKQDYLLMPVVQNQKSLAEFMQFAPYGFLLPPQFEQSISRRIRHELMNVGDLTFPTLDSLSAMLHTTPSTLSRRLREENTTYQQIKDGVRRDMAIHYLTTSAKSISEISMLLGYQDVSIFHRAFKKWAGVTPGAYRLSPETEGLTK